MGKTRSIKGDGEKLVRRDELARMLTRFARAADASMSVKVETMKAEIIAELRKELLFDEVKG